MSKDIIHQDEPTRKDKKQKKLKKPADPASDEPRGTHILLNPHPFLTDQDKLAEKKDKKDKKKKHKEPHGPEVITAAVSEEAEMDVDLPEGMRPRCIMLWSIRLTLSQHVSRKRRSQKR